MVTVGLSGFVLLSTSGLAQSKSDFSGQWELTEALVTGASRDGTTSDKPRRTTSTTISGAPVNCGRGCTISQKGQTLTIDHALLGGDAKDKPPPPGAKHRERRDCDLAAERAEVRTTTRAALRNGPQEG